MENLNVESSFYVGVDLGQSQDFTAVVVLQALAPFIPGSPAPTPRDNFTAFGVGDATGQPSRPRMPSNEPVKYHVNHVYRFDLGTPYPIIEAKLIEYAKQFIAWGVEWDIIIDSTGVGRPVTDSLIAAGLDPVAVIIHGGTNTYYDKWSWKVPKRDLVSGAQVLLGKKLLKIADGPLKETLENELRSFEVDVSKGHDTYGAAESGPWRLGKNDDIVLALCLAYWRAKRQLKKRITYAPVTVSSGDDDEDSPYHSMFWDREHKESKKFRSGL
jgi:hypothetical protein